MFSLDNHALFQATTHPFLEAMAENPNGNYQARGGYHHRPISNFKSSFRPLAAVSSNWDYNYNNGGPPDYGDYHQQNYPPSGGGWDHPHNGGYVAPAPHPPERPSSSLGFGKFKKGGNSAMTALTLLSFFFFVNLLQSCLKEHMSTINPTVMVMTSGVIRNRSNKLAEMNSRERSTSPTAIATDGHILIEPEDLVSAAASVVPITVPPTVTIQTAYSDSALKQQSSILESHLKLRNPYATPSSTISSNVYESISDFPNRTLISSSSFSSTENQRPHHADNEHNSGSTIYSPQLPISDTNHWSYISSITSADTPFRDRYNSPYSGSSFNSYYGDSNNYYDRNRDRDRYGDRHFTRIN